MMMNMENRVQFEKTEGLKDQQPNNSTEHSTTPFIPSIFSIHHEQINKNIKSTKKPNPNFLISYFKTLYITLFLSLFFIFVTILTILIHLLVTFRIIHHRLIQLKPQPQQQTTITTHLPNSWEEEEDNNLYHEFGGGGGFRLSRSDLQKLLIFNYEEFELVDSATTTSTTTTKDCIICLESLKEGECCRILPKCKHIFHANCVDSWLIQVPSCPICREIVTNNQTLK